MERGRRSVGVRPARDRCGVVAAHRRPLDDDAPVGTRARAAERDGGRTLSAAADRRRRAPISVPLRRRHGAHGDLRRDRRRHVAEGDRRGPAAPTAALDPPRRCTVLVRQLAVHARVPGAAVRAAGHRARQREQRGQRIVLRRVGHNGDRALRPVRHRPGAARGGRQGRRVAARPGPPRGGAGDRAHDRLHDRRDVWPRHRDRGVRRRLCRGRRRAPDARRGDDPVGHHVDLPHRVHACCTAAARPSPSPRPSRSPRSCRRCSSCPTAGSKERPSAFLVGNMAAAVVAIGCHLSARRTSAPVEPEPLAASSRRRQRHRCEGSAATEQPQRHERQLARCVRVWGGAPGITA